MVHEPIVLGQEGQRAVLNCHVYADPEATVSWYKNTLLLKRHPRYKIIAPPNNNDSSKDSNEKENQRQHHKGGGGRRHNKHKHELIVEKVSIEDFANYTCLASNNMGKADADIELRGKLTILFLVHKV